MAPITNGEGANHADSAGTPWEGRHFEQNDWEADDGAAPEKLIEAIRRFRSRDVGETEVVDALRESRLLVPLIAQLGEAGTNDHGLTIDKSQELSIVTVSGPDGRNVLPAFTSVEAMRSWNSLARPVPVAATRVALAAASESTDLVVLDPTSATEYVIRRPALWAIAQAEAWVPSYLDPTVDKAVTDAAATVSHVRRVSLEPGDPDARLAGPELVVRIALDPGLDAGALREVTAAVQQRLALDETISSRVDSLTLRLEAAS
jgi:hypothetical protein